MKALLWLLGLAYFFSPYDLFPDLVAGWGWIDDLLLAGFLWWFYQRRFRPSPQRFQRETFEEPTTRSSEPPAEEPGRPRTPYEILGVRQSAPPEEIRRAYRELVTRYHPDKVQHLGEEFQKLAEKKFKEIQEAYRQLTT